MRTYSPVVLLIEIETLISVAESVIWIQSLLSTDADSFFFFGSLSESELSAALLLLAVAL